MRTIYLCVGIQASEFGQRVSHHGMSSLKDSTTATCEKGVAAKQNAGGQISNVIQSVPGNFDNT